MQILLTFNQGGIIMIARCNRDGQPNVTKNKEYAVFNPQDFKTKFPNAVFIGYNSQYLLRGDD